MLRRQELTVDRLLEVLRYDAVHGSFVWKVRRSSKAMPGVVAGSIQMGGYRQIVVDGVTYVAHRLVWLCETRTWPEGDLDHINGVRDDNRFSNLREATASMNLINSVRKLGRSGYRGIALLPSGNWRVSYPGGRRHSRVFSNISDAVESRRLYIQDRFGIDVDGVVQERPAYPNTRATGSIRAAGGDFNEIRPDVATDTETASSEAPGLKAEDA